MVQIELPYPAPKQTIPRGREEAGYGRARRASDTLHKVKEGSCKDLILKFDIVIARIVDKRNPGENASVQIRSND